MLRVDSPRIVISHDGGEIVGAGHLIGGRHPANNAVRVNDGTRRSCCQLVSQAVGRNVRIGCRIDHHQRLRAGKCPVGLGRQNWGHIDFIDHDSEAIGTCYWRHSNICHHGGDHICARSLAFRRGPSDDAVTVDGGARWWAQEAVDGGCDNRELDEVHDGHARSVWGG